MQPFLPKHFEMLFFTLIFKPSRWNAALFAKANLTKGLGFRV